MSDEKLATRIRLQTLAARASIAQSTERRRLGLNSVCECSGPNDDAYSNPVSSHPDRLATIQPLAFHALLISQIVLALAPGLERDRERIEVALAIRPMLQEDSGE